MVWGAKAAWGAGGAASSDRAKLPKGSEPCHICGEDNMCEVKLKPCNHEMCLSCCNTMRQGIVFKADAGLKCPFCREYVDGFTDMNGRADTISDLVEANRAARKSRVARKTGMDKAVSTGVPDPQRLVPPISRSTSTSSHAAAPAEPGWMCPACRRTNAALKMECTHCRTPHPDRALGPAKDLLTCSDEEVARALCERTHVSLYRALADAGMTHDRVSNSLGGNGDSIRTALRGRRHERLMKAAHVLASQLYCERVSTHEFGNYAVQLVLEGAHRVRMEASALLQQDALPPEHFSWAPSTNSGSSSSSSSAAHDCLAMTAFSKLLRVLTTASMLHNLCMSDQGVHVLVRLIKLSSPPETAYIADQVMHDLADMVTSKGGALVLCTLIDRLAVAASCDNPGIVERATGAIVRMCSHLCQHHRSLQQCARHQYLGPKVAELLQCGLPAADAFKMGYELVQNAPALAATRHGSRTLQLLTEGQAADARSREMLRDIVCYASKALQGHFGQLAAKGESGGPALVRALLDFLLAEREDDWVVQVTKELLAAGGELRRDREAMGLLVHSLALPLWRPTETQQHWAALQATGVDVAALKPKVNAAVQHEPRLRERVLPSLSEVQPSSPADAVRRFPHYMRDGGQAVRNSALRKQQSTGQASVPPPPPPREQQAQQPRAAPPGFGAAAAAAVAALPAAAKVPPPGFAAGPPAAPAAAPAAVTFPNGTSVPMPQPYGASSSSSAAPAPSASSAAAVEQKQQANSAPPAAAPAASKPVPPPAPQPPVAAAAPVPVPPPSPLRPAAPVQQAPAVPPPAPVPAPAPMQPAAAPRPPAPMPQPMPAPQPALVQPPPAMRPPVPAPAVGPPGMNAAARPFVQAAPPPGTLPLPPHLQPSLQQQQQQAAPAHLQALPPHLRQQAPAAAGSGAGAAGMSAPITPPPAQHPAGGFTQPPPPQQLLQQLLGSAAPRPAAALPPHLQQAVAGPGSAAAFEGYGSLTEMLTELTAAAAPQPVAPQRPAYRPAYRPPGAAAYRPPTATAPPPAPAPVPAPAPRPVGVPAPSPATRFPMPGAPRPAPVPAAAAPPPAAAPARPAAPAVPVAAAATWECKVCTYRHEGAESQFLSCAMCGSPQS